ncbi:MAG: hypothetical protein MCM46_08950 [Candidatus Manganitrophus sp. SB1]|nr:hypothetical protein [Candidatus Manganitrophus morganii]
MKQKWSTGFRKFHTSLGVLIVLNLVASGCAARPISQIHRFMYKDHLDSDSIHYISKVIEPAIQLYIPGGHWNVVQKPTFTVFETIKGPRKIINIFEFEDSFLKRKFHKIGFTGKQALEEYYRIESEHLISKNAKQKSKIIAVNIDGLITPNILWLVEGPDKQTFFISASKNRRLISISFQDLDNPPNGQESVTRIFQSMKFLSEEKVNEKWRQLFKIDGQ